MRRRQPLSAADVLTLKRQLSDKTSSKRRSAAKRLRKAPAREACSAVLEALRRELHDERTWETQYHMIMALAECGCRESLPLLLELATHRMSATMLLVAVGDAIVRLRQQYDGDASPVFRAFKLAVKNDKALAEGAMRAVAMQHLRFEPDIIDQLIKCALDLKDASTLFWTAAACPGWSGPAVRRFLEACQQCPQEETRRAAKAALEGKYLTWKPL